MESIIGLRYLPHITTLTRNHYYCRLVAGLLKDLQPRIYTRFIGSIEQISPSGVPLHWNTGTLWPRNIGLANDLCWLVWVQVLSAQDYIRILWLQHNSIWVIGGVFVLFCLSVKVGKLMQKVVSIKVCAYILNLHTTCLHCRPVYTKYVLDGWDCGSGCKM